MTNDTCFICHDYQDTSDKKINAPPCNFIFQPKESHLYLENFFRFNAILYHVLVLVIRET